MATKNSAAVQTAAATTDGAGADGTADAVDTATTTGTPDPAVEKTDQPDPAADGAEPKTEPVVDAAQTAAEAVAKATPVVDAAPVVLPAESVVKTDKGSYIVASPIKHDGEDYAPGDTIRLPEAVAHRLAGYLEA